MSYSNNQILFIQHAQDLPGPDNFTAGRAVIERCEADKVIIRNHFLSVDPAQKGWMSPAKNYASASLGEPMRALAVGQIVESCLEGYAEGDFVTGWFGWQEYAHVGSDQIERIIDANDGPLSYQLGVFGLNGLTAYIALEDLLAPKAGDTLLVSTAAGAVGSIVGQLARAKGCTVIGLTGSAEKVDLCQQDYGYHHALNYKEPGWEKALSDLAPEGIHAYYDMAGGWITDEVFPLMAQGGRIAQVGTASVAAWQPVPSAPRRERHILVKELTHRGFVVFNHEHRFTVARQHLLQLINHKQLVLREDIRQGLDSAPQALSDLYQGTNQGKVLIQLS